MPFTGIAVTLIAIGVKIAVVLLQNLDTSWRWSVLQSSSIPAKPDQYLDKSVHDPFLIALATLSRPCRRRSAYPITPVIPQEQPAVGSIEPRYGHLRVVNSSET